MAFKCSRCSKRIELRKEGSFLAKFTMRPGKVDRKIFCSLSCANLDEAEGLENKVQVINKPQPVPPQSRPDVVYAVPEKGESGHAPPVGGASYKHQVKSASEGIYSAGDTYAGADQYVAKSPQPQDAKEPLQYPRIELDPFMHRLRIIGSPKTQIERIMDLLKRYHAVKDIPAGDFMKY